MTWLFAITALALCAALLRQQRQIELLNNLVMDVGFKVAVLSFELGMERMRRRSVIEAAIGDVRTEMHDRDNALETEMDARNGTYANALARTIHRVHKLERGI